jgi:hypothetical protein
LNSSKVNLRDKSADQDWRLQQIIAQVGQVEELIEIDIPDELAEPKSFLKVLRANHYNWESERFRKLFGMRFRVKIPQIEQLNTIFYPRPEYGTPIFIFFAMLTKRKVIAHLNVNCVFDDADYRKRWVDPLARIVQSYEPFDSDDRYPEWMKRYRNESTIYGLFPIDRLQDLSDCCFEYLDYYLSQVKEDVPETDPERLLQIQKFQDRWVDDIRTQDKAQGMMAKMIGAKTARRIFYEVTT